MQEVTLSAQDKGRASRLWLLFRWILPVAVLGIIGSRVDFSRLAGSLSTVDPLFLVLGVCTFPLGLMSCAFRWTCLTRAMVKWPVGYWFMLSHYWYGMSMGRFVPGSIGSDIYRLLALGRRTGAYGAAALVIVLEKVAGIAGISLVFLTALHLAVPQMDRSWHLSKTVQLGVAAVVLLALVVLGAASMLRSSRVLYVLTRTADRLVHKATARIMREAETRKRGAANGNESGEVAGLDLFLRLLLVVLLTLPIIFFSALAHQLFLLSLGQSVPLSANVLLVTLLSVAAFAPLSIGNLGIREGGFIFVYGLYGVEMETSLLAALFMLSSMLLMDGMGVLLLMARVGGRLNDTSPQGK